MLFRYAHRADVNINNDNNNNNNNNNDDDDNDDDDDDNDNNNNNDNNDNDREDDHHVLRKEVEAAVQSLKKEKSAEVDNIPAELVQAGGEEVITTLTTIRNKIWQTGEWPTPWTRSLVITLPKKSNLQQCQNYRTTNLIAH